MTPHYGIDDQKFNGTPLNGREWDIVSRILDSQAPGALQAAGVGVIDSEEFSSGTSFAVGIEGNVVSVSAGAGIAAHNLYGHVFLKSPSGGTASGTIEADSTHYIHAVARYASAPDQPDSRQDAVPLFIISQNEEVNGGILLAEVESTGSTLGTPVDRRAWSSVSALRLLITQLQAQVSAIQLAIGWPYEATDDITARLDALENPALPDGSDEVTAAVFIALANRVTALEARVAVLEAANGQVATVRVPSNNERLWAEYGLLLAQVAKSQAHVALRSSSAVVVPGRCGRGEVLPNGDSLPTNYVGGNMVYNEEEARLE